MARILIVAEDPREGRGLSGILRRQGHGAHLVDAATTPERILRRQPDLLVLSVPDPARLLQELAQEADGALRRIPALAITQVSGDPAGAAEVLTDPNLEAAITGRATGAEWLLDPLPMPFSDGTLLARIEGLLRVRDILAHSPEAGGDATAPPSSTVGIGLVGRLMSRVRGDRTTPVDPEPAGSPGARLQTAAALVAAVERRDAFDYGHGDRVAFHCATIATALGLPDEESALLLHAAWAHDIGKVALPAGLFAKEELTEADRALLRAHPRRGAQILRALSPWVDAAPIIACHHERPDGHGYYGLAKERVPRGAWILAVAEAYDAMTRSRQRAALAPDAALDLLSDGRGTKWDPEALDALVSTVRPRPRGKSLPVSPDLTPLATLKS